MKSKLGIIAGSGGLPVKIISICKQTGRDFFVLAFHDQTDEDLVEGLPHEWAHLGEVNKALSALTNAGAEEVVFCGRINRPSLSSLKLDKRGAKMMAKLALKGMGDDAVLKAIMKEVEKEGLTPVGVQDVIGGILATEGKFGTHTPDEQALQDIKRGREVLQSMSTADVGQAVVIQEGMVLGVEAIEGTDELIKRSGTLKRPGSKGILVKMRKLNQDERADLPTVGPETVKQIKDAGLGGIAVETGGTIIIDREELITLADQSGIFIVGVEGVN
jgi:UDP-2,3-diacylglucosamine hydrolase